MHCYGYQPGSSCWQINHECIGVPPSNSPKCDSTITSLVDKHVAYERHGDGSARLMDDETAQIDLLSILQCAWAPLYLYPEVWKWAQSSYDHKVSFRLKGTRESVIKHLQTQYNLFGTMPATTKVKLASSAEVNIVLEQLYSLLSDPDLMNDENLLFTDGNPFQAPSASTKMVKGPVCLNKNLFRI